MRKHSNHVNYKMHFFSLILDIVIIIFVCLSVCFSWIYLTYASEHAIIIKWWNNNTNVILFSIVCFIIWLCPKMNEYECNLNTNKASCTATVACRPFPLNCFLFSPCPSIASTAVYVYSFVFLWNGWFKTI